MNTSIPSDIRERVLNSADELYRQANRERFPTVDAVRRASRADMNTVSGLMRAWRQAQTAQAAPVEVVIPDSIRQVGSAALASMWQQATELANQSLRSAQAGWEAERQDLDEVRAELSGSFEVQAEELESTKARVVELSEELEAERGQRADDVARMEKLNADLQAQLTQATERAHTAEARAVEIEKRADDLRAMLENSQQTSKANAERADVVTGELAAVSAKAEAADLAHQEQRKVASAEAHRAAERVIKMEAERDAARKEASFAREESAKLSGVVESMQAQVADLMLVVGQKGANKPGKN